MPSVRVATVALLLLLLPALSGCFDLGGVGPRDYVSGSRYTKWVVEVDYATGKQPSTDLLTFLEGRLEAVVNKPDGVEFRLGESLSDSNRRWGFGELQSYAASHAGMRTEGSTVVLHLLFVKGSTEQDSGDSKVLGVAFGAGPIAIFSDSIDGLCAGILLNCNTANFYRSVVLHEFGHAMGLVNNGIPMVTHHEASSCGDESDSGHSTNQNSVMFCAVENSTDILGLFGNAPPTTFDEQDRADLKAAGGK